MSSDPWAVLYVIILAVLVGYIVISRVPVILHTPLMSGSNFIHGIVLVGAILALGLAQNDVEKIIGFLAVVMASLNVTGGYVVTERMLKMFRKGEGKR